MSEFAMQSRCVHCTAEHHVTRVWELSTKGGRCSRCGQPVTPMTYERYRQALAAAMEGR